MRTKTHAESSVLDYWLWRNRVTPEELARRTKAMDPDGEGVSERTIKYWRNEQQRKLGSGKGNGPQLVKKALIVCAATNWGVQIHELVDAEWLRQLQSRRAHYYANVVRRVPK